MIAKFQFSDYRILRNVSGTLAPFTMLIGPNGCGKSTLMEALVGLIRDANEATSFGVNIQIENSPEASGWLEFPSTEKDKRLRIALQKNKGSPVGSLRCMELSDDNLSIMPEAGSAIGLPLQFSERPKFSNIYGFNPAKLKEPAGKLQTQSEISRDGGQFAWHIANMKLHDDAIYNSLNESISKIVPSVEKVLVDGKSNSDYYTLEIQLKNGLRIPAHHTSDGTIYAIALIAALIQNKDQPGLVCIDDIDQGLHPLAQRELIRCIRNIQLKNPQLQIVASTHSPYLLSEMRYEEIRAMTVDSDYYSCFAPLVDHPEFEKWKEEMNPGEFWSVVGESWLANAKDTTKNGIP